MSQPTDFYSIDPVYPKLPSDAMRAIQSLGEKVPLLPEKLKESHSNRQHRTVTRWIEGKTPEEIKPVLDQIAAQVPWRVHPLISLIMAHRQTLGYENGLFAINVADLVVDAVAVGIHRHLPGINITWMDGLGMGKRDGVFSRLRGEIRKDTTLKRAKEAGRVVSLVVESNSSGVDVLRMGAQGLVVDPLTRLGKEAKFYGFDRVDTHTSSLYRVHLTKGQRTMTEPGRYDLSVYNEREAFLRDLFPDPTNE